MMFLEKDLTAEKLAECIDRLAGDPVVRGRMGEAMRKAAFPDAATAIVDVCRQMINAG